MSESDADTTDELRDLIARARQDGPAPQRLATVRARLEAQLGPLDGPPAPVVSAKAALGLVAVAAVIAIGVWLGTRPGDRPALGTDIAPPSEVPSAASPDPGPPPVVAVPREEPRSDAPATDIQPPIEAAAEEEAPEPALRAERSARRVTPAPEPIVPEPTEDPASMLREEIALLDRALRAREAGDPERAVAALEEHRARFPSGRLQPERDRMLGELAITGTATTP